jgi:hypothetical protein
MDKSRKLIWFWISSSAVNCILWLYYWIPLKFYLCSYGGYCILVGCRLHICGTIWSCVLLEGLKFGYVQGVVDIFRIKVLKMGHPLPVLQIVDRILNSTQNSFASFRVLLLIPFFIVSVDFILICSVCDYIKYLLCGDVRIHVFYVKWAYSYVCGYNNFIKICY